MGREIRIVPPNYEHPTRECRHWPRCDESFDHYQPQYNVYFEDRYTEWLSNFTRMKFDGLNEEEKRYHDSFSDWLKDEGGAPDLAFYRLYKDDEASWFQVYETVSEGTPVTPPFETKHELINYLIKHGDFWQQKRWKEGDSFMQPTPPGYSREAAESFVNDESYVPSFVMKNGVITEGIEVCGLKKD